ncbi:hypothetical protein B0H19DRAFT_1203245 [Mycena capillaripes]|nr:hypothetical protein B0H19DRAFT_1203245 [Mycena capillaripes]
MRPESFPDQLEISHSYRTAGLLQKEHTHEHKSTQQRQRCQYPGGPTRGYCTARQSLSTP